jgi:hypothetical protein
MDIEEIPMIQKEYVTRLTWEENGEPKIAYRVTSARVRLPRP